MELFHGLGKRLSETFETVSKRTSEATELARQNRRIGEIDQEVKNLYGQIGRVYCEKVQEGEQAVAEAVVIFTDKIAALNAEKEAVKNAMDRLKNQCRCPGCGETQPRTAKFCAHCGTKMPEEPTPEPEAEPEEAEPDEAEARPSEKKAEPSVEIDWPEPDAREAAQDGEIENADSVESEAASEEDGDNPTPETEDGDNPTSETDGNPTPEADDGDKPE